MKRTLVFATIFCMLLALLCGCGATPTTPVDDTSATTTTVAVTTTATEAQSATTATEATTTAEAQSTTAEATVVTTEATAAPTTTAPPVTHPVLDPSIPVLKNAVDPNIRTLGGYITVGDFEYWIGLEYGWENGYAKEYLGVAKEVVISTKSTPYYNAAIADYALYTAALFVPLSAFDNTSVESVRYQKGTSFLASYDINVNNISHLYLPEKLQNSINWVEDYPGAAMLWNNLLSNGKESTLHIYLIKDTPLTQTLCNTAYTPHNWKLDFSEEGVYEYVYTAEGKPDRTICFHVAESFE